MSTDWWGVNDSTTTPTVAINSRGLGGSFFLGGNIILTADDFWEGKVCWKPQAQSNLDDNLGVVPLGLGNMPADEVVFEMRLD